MATCPGLGKTGPTRQGRFHRAQSSPAARLSRRISPCEISSLIRLNRAGRNAGLRPRPPEDSRPLRASPLAWRDQADQVAAKFFGVLSTRRWAKVQASGIGLPRNTAGRAEARYRQRAASGGRISTSRAWCKGPGRGARPELGHCQALGDAGPAHRCGSSGSNVRRHQDRQLNVRVADQCQRFSVRVSSSRMRTSTRKASPVSQGPVRTLPSIFRPRISAPRSPGRRRSGTRLFKLAVIKRNGAVYEKVVGRCATCRQSCDDRRQ